MDWLELRVPPLLLAGITALLMWAVSVTVPPVNLSTHARTGAMILFVLFGSAVVVSGVLAFRRTGTTVDPTKPESSKSLVSGGVYRWTRNPMYLGFCSFLIAWGCFLPSLLSMPLVVAFAMYLNRFQIGPEERVLEQVFGDEYADYRSNVRRWL